MTKLSDLLFNSSRGTGKTTAICKAAKEIGATVLTHSHAEAQRLIREYGVDALSLTRLSNELGKNKSYLVDTHAFAVELADREDKIAKLESTLAASTLNHNQIFESYKKSFYALEAAQVLHDAIRPVLESMIADAHEEESGLGYRWNKIWDAFNAFKLFRK